MDLQEFPTEVITRILSFVPPSSLVLFGSSSHHWRDLILPSRPTEFSELIWRQEAKNYLGTSVSASSGWRTVVGLCKSFNSQANALIRKRASGTDDKSYLSTLNSFLNLLAKGNHYLYFYDMCLAPNARLPVTAGALTRLQTLTPLHAAAHNGSYEFARLLLERNIVDMSSMQKPTRRSPSPLEVACASGKLDIVDLILEFQSKKGSGAEVDLESVLSASGGMERLIISAAKGGYIQLLHKLIAIKTEKIEGDEAKAIEATNVINSKSRDSPITPNRSALMCAIQEKKVNMIRVLLNEYKADWRTSDGKGNHPIAIAAAIGGVKLLKVLEQEIGENEFQRFISSGGYIHSNPTRYSTGVLTIVIKSQLPNSTKFEILDWLMERGGRIFLQSWKNQDILLEAADSAEVLEWLLEQCRRVDAMEIISSGNRFERSPDVVWNMLYTAISGVGSCASYTRIRTGGVFTTTSGPRESLKSNTQSDLDLRSQFYYKRLDLILDYYDEVSQKQLPSANEGEVLQRWDNFFLLEYVPVSILSVLDSYSFDTGVRGINEEPLIALIDRLWARFDLRAEVHITRYCFIKLAELLCYKTMLHLFQKFPQPNAQQQQQQQRHDFKKQIQPIPVSDKTSRLNSELQDCLYSLSNIPVGREPCSVSMNPDHQGIIDDRLKNGPYLDIWRFLFDIGILTNLDNLLNTIGSPDLAMMLADEYGISIDRKGRYNRTTLLLHMGDGPRLSTVWKLVDEYKADIHELSASGVPLILEEGLAAATTFSVTGHPSTWIFVFAGLILRDWDVYTPAVKEFKYVGIACRFVRYCVEKGKEEAKRVCRVLLDKFQSRYEEEVQTKIGSIPKEVGDWIGALPRSSY